MEHMPIVPYGVHLNRNIELLPSGQYWIQVKNESGCFTIPFTKSKL
jgi:hypothetical protein